MLIGVLFMGKRLSRREIGSLVLSYVGIALAFAQDLEFAGDSHAVLLGATFFCFLAVLTFYLAGNPSVIDKRSSGTMAGEWRQQGISVHPFCRSPSGAASSPVAYLAASCIDVR